MVSHVRRSIVLLGLALVGPAYPSAAQHPYAPGVAFGAYVFPHLGGNRDTWALQFDLFTELSKDLDPYNPGALDPTPPGADFEKYNDIDRTLGYIQVGHTWVRAKTLGSFGLHGRLSGSGGVVWDTPTEFLQNDVAHGIRNLTYVPRDSVRDHFVLSAGGELMGTYSIPLGPFLFVPTAGLGGDASTTFNDGYAQGGALLKVNNAELAGGLVRAGLVGTQFSPQEELAPGLDTEYWLWQAWGMLPLNAIWPWFPRFRVAHMQSWGPFLTSPQISGVLAKKEERFWSIRLETPAGRWAMEMWNDLGYKDLGPTFGLLIQWQR